jgi:dTDP-6-deoxy-L-talose 4-dehydrogenase (NAD+)
MSKKFLVTGATGFVGNYVIQELLKREQVEVIASSANRDSLRRCMWSSQVTYIPLNLKDFDPEKDYYKHFNRPDHVIHLSWEGLPNFKDQFHIEKNLPQQKAFLENLIRNGAKDITVAGTCFEYGMKEGMLSEVMEPQPENPYAIAKNELHNFLKKLKKKHDFHLKWARLFYMYGKGQNPGSLIPQLEQAIQEHQPEFRMSGGEQVRDFLPIEKIGEYIAEIAMQQKVEGVINVCSGQPVTVKEFVQNYLKEIKKKIPLNLGYYPYADYEAMRFWGDDTKLRSILANH